MKLFHAKHNKVKTFSSLLIKSWSGLVVKTLVCCHEVFGSKFDGCQASFSLTLLLNYSRLNGWINMVPFPFVALLVFDLYLRRSFRSMRGFYLPQEVYGTWLVFSLRKVFTCFLCTLFSSLMGRLFDHSFLLMSIFKESQWV